MNQASIEEPTGSAETSSNAPIGARFEVPSQQLGLEPPAATTHLRFYPTATACRLLVWSSEPRKEPTLRWLSNHGEFQLRDPPGFDPRVIQLEFQDVPPPWKMLLERFPSPQIEIRPDGTASISLQGTREDLQWFVEHQQQAGRAPTIKRIGPDVAEESDGTLLTPRQHKALVLATTSGYYEVPREVNLRELATQMDISAGSLSELLRRAEERLAKAYLQATTSGLEPAEPPTKSFALPPIGLTGDLPEAETEQQALAEA